MDLLLIMKLRKQRDEIQDVGRGILLGILISLAVWGLIVHFGGKICLLLKMVFS